MSSLSKQNASNTMIESAMPTVWDTIDDELRRRKKSGAWLGQQLVPPASRQTINGWKERGVPSSRYEDIAKFFGWTVDRLLTGADIAEAASEQAALAYSPQALHLARMFDELPTTELKMRIYWKITQLIATGDSPPWTAEDPPTQPEPSRAAPGFQPTLVPRPTK